MFDLKWIKTSRRIYFMNNIPCSALLQAQHSIWLIFPEIDHLTPLWIPDSGVRVLRLLIPPASL